MKPDVLYPIELVPVDLPGRPSQLNNCMWCRNVPEAGRRPVAYAMHLEKIVTPTYPRGKVLALCTRHAGELLIRQGMERVNGT